ncbi:hypothetical protein ABTE84_19920, partial [Acinetobacter baumannii]
DASPVEPSTSTAVSAPAAHRSVDLDDEDARWAAYAASAEPEAPAAEPVRDEYRTDATVPAAAAAGAAAVAPTVAYADESRPVGAAQPI